VGRLSPNLWEMRPVTVQSFKNPDVLHWGYEGLYLGGDEWGAWVSVPSGSARRRLGADVDPTDADAVFCAPRDGWWHLHYEGPAARKYVAFVDITTPPVWVSENRYEAIDLDLDVALYVDGTIEVQDEDEFEEHQVVYGYTQEMIDRALAETDRIVEALRSRQEPFFEVAAEWLAAAVAPTSAGGRRP